jgi:hypothetical protein
MTSDSQKKLWNWQSALVDHVRITVRIPMMILAPVILTAVQIEAIQSAVSDVNSSNIGSVWHKRMSQIAGLDGAKTKVQVFSRYGRSFGSSDGAGSNAEAMYNELVVGQSAMVARAAEATAFLQFHMDLVGNTVLAFLRGTLRGAKRNEQSVIFEIIFVIYYISMYSTMAFASSALKNLPSDSPGIYVSITIVQCLFASMFIIPFGIAGVLMLPVYIFNGGEASPLPPRHYATIPDEISSIVTYSIDVVKPSQQSKVGMRFGSNVLGQVMITNIKQTSIASMSNLQIGDTIFSINGKSATNVTPKEAAAILLNASGVVNIVAAHSEESVFDEECTV